jgi:hypothetical protein
MEFSLKALSHCFLKHYKDYIGEFGHNSQKLSEVLIKGRDIVGEPISTFLSRRFYSEICGLT